MAFGLGGRQPECGRSRSSQRGVRDLRLEPAVGVVRNRVRPAAHAALGSLPRDLGLWTPPRRGARETGPSRSGIGEVGAVATGREGTGMRAVVLCVGMLSVVGCATNRFGTAAGVARRFYLSTATAQGNKALDACAHGYHMASRFELLDPTVLQYDVSVGVTADDAG